MTHSVRDTFFLTPPRKDRPFATPHARKDHMKVSNTFTLKDHTKKVNKSHVKTDPTKLPMHMQRGPKKKDRFKKVSIHMQDSQHTG